MEALSAQYRQALQEANGRIRSLKQSGANTARMEQQMSNQIGRLEEKVAAQTAAISVGPAGAEAGSGGARERDTTSRKQPSRALLLASVADAKLALEHTGKQGRLPPADARRASSLSFSAVAATAGGRGNGAQAALDKGTNDERDRHRAAHDREDAKRAGAKMQGVLGVDKQHALDIFSATVIPTHDHHL